MLVLKSSKLHVQKDVGIYTVHCRGHLRREKIHDDCQTWSNVNTYIMTNHRVTITTRGTTTRIDRR